MALIFSALSMLGWLWARDARTPGQWRLHHTTTILLVLLAVLSKPIAVILPVLFVAFEFCSGPHAGIFKWRWASRANEPLLTRTLGLTAIFIPVAAISASISHRLLDRDPAHGGWLILVLVGCALLTLPAAPKASEFLKTSTAGLRIFGPPFMVLSLVAGAGSAWTLWAQAQVGAIKGTPALFQTLNAVCEVVFAYVEKALVPVRMSVSYSWGAMPSFSVQGFVGAVLLCALVWAGFRFAGANDRNRRLAAFGIFWFLITLIPVSNLVPTSTKMADRYLFLPTIGVILVLLAALSACCGRSRSRLAAAVVGFAALVAVFTVWSHARTEVWCGKTEMWHGQPEPDLALWSSAVASDADDSLARVNLGLTALRLNPPDIEGALTHLRRALELLESNQSKVGVDQKLNFTPAYEGLGNAYLARASQRSAAQPQDQEWKPKKEDYANAVKNYQLTFQAPSGFTKGDVSILRQYSNACEALAQMDHAELDQAAGKDRETLQRERDSLRAESEQALERARKLLIAANVPATDADFRMVVLDQGNVLFNREAGASAAEKVAYYRGALARYQEAASLFPDDPRPLLDEGLCYERLAGAVGSAEDRSQQVALGTAALGKALTLHTTAPDFSPATPYRVMALLYMHTGDYATVLDWLRKARQAAASTADQALIDKDIQNVEPFVRTDRTRH
jgi:tetratricopeptide (TPR) repeat protein